MAEQTATQIVPSTQHRQMFHLLSALSHASVYALQCVVGDQFVWFGMSRDIPAWAHSFYLVSLLRSIITLSPPSLKFQLLTNLSCIFMMIWWDPTSSLGYTYLFTIIDRSTQGLEAVPLQVITATACADALLLHWISHFGVPLNISH